MRTETAATEGLKSRTMVQIGFGCGICAPTAGAVPPRHSRHAGAGHGKRPLLFVHHLFEEATMTRRSGSADLPLHGGRVPAWLGERMTRLGTVMAEAIIHHYGRDALLARLAHPFWFQSFGAVMGMDWHSSGITTSVIGAL